MFGNTYDDNHFNGLLGRQYPQRHDRFQQLIGSYFQELYGSCAHVAPTLGRDGSIDVFVEAPKDGMTPWDNVPFPFVVECKDHESATRDAVINNGWSPVQNKLRERAQAGWPDLYAPWRRTRGYVYCVSPNLSQAVRDELQAKIQEFFDALPTDQRPPIDVVKVLCWSDAAALLNKHPRLADAWLGISFPYVVGHEEYLDGLTHFRGYLKQENLPFVPPDAHCPSHPQRILASLGATGGKPGTLLVGPGGVGKTRTCLETARMAHARGWRVLHYKPTDAQIDLNELGNVLIQGTSKTLLVIDYIDQLGLSFTGLRRDILDLARRRGLHLALLANARPGFLFVDDDNRDALFEQVHLEIAGRQAAIIGNVARAVAPNACERIGESEVRAICGARPIIAMFIARELERMTQAGTLDSESLCRLREADLSEWLRRRLREDQLIPPGSCGVQTPPPLDFRVLASVAGLAATPLSVEELKKVMGTTLDACGAACPNSVAAELLDILTTLGWLEEEGRDQGTRLQSPHDVVTDELLENALFSKGRANIRDACFQPILAAAATMPRVWGRFAVALDRLLGQWPAGSAKSAALVKAAEDWFATSKSALAQAFSIADADETAFALGAAISSRTWHEVVLAHWGEIVLPWLRASVRLPASRHLLHRSLKVLKGQEAQETFALAMVWLDSHGLLPYASFVLDPLLDRDDLGEKAQDAIAAAMAWIDVHPKALETNFVLPPLLGRDDLGEKAQDAIAAAMAWIDVHPKALETNFVLPPLLGRDDLGEKAQAALAAAMAWLGEHPKAMVAQFVLKPLLGRNDLGEKAQAAIAAAMAWLGEHPKAIEADFVLPPLLGRNDLGEKAQAAIAAAMAWLGEHPKAVEAGFVLPPLLGRKDLGGNTQAAITAAIAWLGEHPKALDAQFVFNPLLDRDDLGEKAQDAIAAAMAWIDVHPKALEAGFVLPPLLGRKDLGHHAEQAYSAALTWLEEHFRSQDAEFVVKHLLGNPNLDDVARETCVTLALKRAEKVLDTPEASFILKSCLRAMASSADIQNKIFKLALQWLQSFSDNPHADYVFKRLLRRRNMADNDWTEISTLAIQWLCAQPISPDLDHALNSLCIRAHLLDAPAQKLVAEKGGQWLAAFPDNKECERLRRNLERLSDNPSSPSGMSCSIALKQCLDEGRMPEKSLLEQGLAQAHMILQGSRPASAGYYLSSLLPLSCRLKDLDCFKEAMRACQAFLHALGPDSRPAQGFLNSLMQSLEQGLWPNKELGERLLYRLRAQIKT